MGAALRACHATRRKSGKGMTDDSNRIDALDFLRGLAVMGILLANMVAIGLPSAAQLSPFTLGVDGPLDMAAWAFNFLFVDGKFRALFAIMFGASMLLVMESAELDGRDGFAVHRKRMIWLAAFGIAHHLLIWSGDILLPLAVAGLIATALVRYDTLGLIKWALGLLALQWAIDLVAVGDALVFGQIDQSGDLALVHAPEPLPARRRQPLDELHQEDDQRRHVRTGEQRIGVEHGEASYRKLLTMLSR